MPQYNVTVEKLMRCSGIVFVDAKDPQEAIELVDEMIARGDINTISIDWDDAEYEDFTFQTTGDVD